MISTALENGLLLGAASAVRLAVTGRVLGMSGIFRSVARLDRSLSAFYNLVFLAGLLSVALLYNSASLAASQRPLSHSLSPWYVVFVGFLTGFGTSMGNGCTSGHGITGLAKMTPRSTVATLTFFSVAVAVGTSLNNSSFFDYVHQAPDVPSLRILVLYFLSVAAVALIFSFEVINRLTAEVLIDFLSGAVFAFGLIGSGMSSPASVVQFLDLRSVHWKPDLLFVMMGAHLIMFPSNWFWIRKHPKPILSVLAETTSDVPAPVDSSKADGAAAPKLVVDFNLVMGAAIFGASFGLLGMCPAPILVNTAQPWTSMSSSQFSASLMYIWSFAGLILGTYGHIAYTMIVSSLNSKKVQ